MTIKRMLRLGLILLVAALLAPLAGCKTLGTREQPAPPPIASERDPFFR